MDHNRGKQTKKKKFRRQRWSPLGVPLIQIHTQYPTSRAIRLHPDLIPLLKTRDPPRIDNENRELLLLYNRYIAQDLYGLDLQFAPAAIIPTPVMRYHFLKYVFEYSGPPGQENGADARLPGRDLVVEVGTGASAVIALLAAKCFHKDVYATELDPSYLPIARANIVRNGMEDSISLFKSDGGLLRGVVPPGTKARWIISNPPYYDKILSPKVVWGGKGHELVSGGAAGEDFIVQLIQEGREYLVPGGMVAFILPKTRVETLAAVETYLAGQEYAYDVSGLLVGNRTRYVFRVYPWGTPTSPPEYELA